MAGRGPSRSKLTRRDVLALGAGVAAGATAAPAAERSARASSHTASQERFALFPVVETRYGKVQGTMDGPIAQFRGVPYGAPTGGRNRFMPPQPPQPWSGVRECLGFASICPQTGYRSMDFRAKYFQLIQWDRHVGAFSEDCLNLNLWTPGADGGRRPVLVSFHGGNFDRGSGNLPGYDGKNLALTGDVVVVTVNHRLASLGYLHLADLGVPPELASSGIAGALDMVAALEWVRDNIERFGGDPGRVTVFGQSGGGAKVAALLAMPAAKGLFHRAAIQSGGGLRMATRESATRMAEQLLERLGISRSRAADIQRVPWQRIMEAQWQLADAEFAPVVAGDALPAGPFDAVPADAGSDVPLIIGSTLEDAAMFHDDFELDEAGLMRAIERAVPGSGREIVDLYRAAQPGKSPYLLQAQIHSDRSYRRPALQQAARWARQSRAPVYTYLWTWPSPAYDGKFGAVHFVDVPATFANARDPIMGAACMSGVRMCGLMSSAWVAFARDGKPKVPGAGDWLPFQPERRETMILDTAPRLEQDPRAEIRRFWERRPSRHLQVGV